MLGSQHYLCLSVNCEFKAGYFTSLSFGFPHPDSGENNGAKLLCQAVVKD